MSFALRFVALAAIGVAALHVERAHAVEFVDMVRNLNSLQGELVRGSAAAKAASTKQIVEIEQAIAAAEPESWKEQRNARAAAVFLLCGGAPREVRKVADTSLFSERDLPLVAGSLAYAEGRKQDASRLLLAIDPKAQPVTLGGHLALIQGGLLIGTDNARARELFDLARLLMPSSLVEEAALRREISIVDSQRAADKFLLLARRYVAQYGRSPFTRNFWDEAYSAMMRAALKMEEPQLAEFQSLFRNAAPSTRFEIHMAVARMAILNARIALAAAQTKQAEPFAETAAAKSRLRFYLAAIDALAGDFDEAANVIRNVDARSLSRADSEMRDIVTQAIERLKNAQESGATGGPVAKGEPDARNASPDASALETSARQALADSEALLRKANRQ